MIGIFLITHGACGESFLQNAIHVLNYRPPQMVAFGLVAQDDPLELLPVARSMLASVDSGDGVLILTDIYGASPANLAMKLLQPGRVEGLAGLNLPMLLRALRYREKGMAQLIKSSLSGAGEGMLQMEKQTQQGATVHRHSKSGGQ